MKKSNDRDLDGPPEFKENTSLSGEDLFDQICDLKSQLNQQEYRTKEAENKLDMQARFFATVSHEIRTSMGAIIGLADILIDADLDAPQDSHAKTLKNTTTGLLRVLNDVLDQGKLENGQFELVLSHFSPRETIKRIFETHSGLCQNKGLTFRLEFADDLPEYIFSDPLRIEQVLANLISNALKFTASGSIDITVSRLNNDTDLPHLRISIKDTGIGLSPQLNERFFSPYAQADAGISAQYGGTGLGLYICRQLVSLMGGDIGYNSEVGRGAEFWFTFKGQNQPVNVASRREVATAPEIDHTGHILIVEDNETNQMLISAYLEKFGHSFEIAISGTQALERLRLSKFDVILMDVKMPGLDGIEVTRMIRQGDNYARSTPIIALTAKALAGDRKKYLDAGMQDYVSKPINVEKLYFAIDKALAKRQALAS